MMKRLLFFLILLGLGGLLLIFLANSVLMPAYTRLGRETLLPAVIGMQEADAISSLSQEGFRVEIESRKPDPRGLIPAGAVLEQFPSPGSLTKTERRVYLSICSGDLRIPAPNLLGMTRREAGVLLADLRLREDSLNVRYLFDPGHGAGTILEQSPRADSLLRRGTALQFVISLGPRPERVKVPGLLGLSLADAEMRLHEAGLHLGKTDVEYNGRRLKGVRAQLPVAGQNASPDDSVYIRVNLGSPNE